MSFTIRAVLFAREIMRPTGQQFQKSMNHRRAMNHRIMTYVRVPLRMVSRSLLQISIPEAWAKVHTRAYSANILIFIHSGDIRKKK